MAEHRPLLLVIGVLFAAGLVVTAVILFSRRQSESSALTTTGPGHRLAVLARQRSDYRILVGVPADAPARWAPASRVTDSAVEVEGYGAIPLAEVRAFVVSYPNGQVLDCEPAGLPSPAGLTGLTRGRGEDDDLLRPEDLEEGRKYIEVKYGRSELAPGDPNRYSTTLVNISGQRIKVLRFAGYKRTREGWKLSTVTGSFYSAEEFRAWYGLGKSAWIAPGEAAADPNNYGSPPVLWAYYCRAEDGKEFIAGGVLE